MALPQPGIFAVGTSSHAYVELDLTAAADPAAAVGVLADLAERETTMGATNLVVGVRPEVWARVSPGTLPEGLTGFEADVVGADGFTMPATQHDLALWFAAASYDVVFDATLDALGKLAPHAALATELGAGPTTATATSPASRTAPRTRRSRARPATPWSRTAPPAPAARCGCSSSGHTTREPGPPWTTRPRPT